MSESKSIIDIPIEYREEDENILEEVEEIKIDEQTNVTNSGPPLEIWVPANYADTQATINTMQAEIIELGTKVAGIPDIKLQMRAMIEFVQQQQAQHLQEQQRYQQELNDRLNSMMEAITTNVDQVQTLRRDMVQNCKQLSYNQQQSSDIAVYNDQVMEHNWRTALESTAFVTTL